MKAGVLLFCAEVQTDYKCHKSKSGMCDWGRVLCAARQCEIVEYVHTWIKRLIDYVCKCEDVLVCDMCVYTRIVCLRSHKNKRVQVKRNHVYVLITNQNTHVNIEIVRITR